MAPRTKKSKAAKRTTSTSRVTVDRGESRTPENKKSDGNFLDKIQTDLEKNQSYLNLILGALIVIVLGVLIFNYFNKPAEEPGDVGPSQQQAMTDENGDVTKEGLPGKYKVKEGDTLFLIAQKYYDDGNRYTEIVRENNLTTESIEVGQELTIPKIDMPSPSPDASASASPEASASPSESPLPSPSASPASEPQAAASPATDSSDMGDGKGGAENQTVWGEKISGNSYTVVAGDWLSTISGRAYGDIMKYDMIAKANNISNPNIIEIGTVLNIPRD